MTSRSAGSCPDAALTRRPTPSSVGSQSTVWSAPVTRAAAPHSPERAASLPESPASSWATSATRSIRAALAASAGVRARFTSMSMKTPATSRVVTVVSHRASGELAGSFASVPA